ncbi:hypothetical protein FC72_GL000855 [Companilactobacillus tucceti DSM 20183]|uniref:Uncharacterized protein n=1 Tax=Companilactobacillus tucceti DSM 20183 TaxID=1423811 RepID=A0A0R1J8J3_9LACO|nr:hypothetical protein [Companilactobacillus tucceti]KRK63970.1 hypothetical protein FC72_GL000855 [Companilactobacillus tucceti DSM 20183]
MKKIYDLDKVSLVGIFLMYFFLEIIMLFLGDKNMVGAPAAAMKFKFFIFAIKAILSFAVFYGIFYLLLKNTKADMRVVFVNIIVGLVVTSILSSLVFAFISKDANILYRIITGAIGFGLMMWLNWKNLKIDQTNKIKITVWNVIWFVLSIV